jgi:serine/threonine protein phosphatase PrpC
MSRSIGDKHAHRLGVSSEPEFEIVKLDRKRNTYILILATDGLWNVYGPSMVQKYVTLISKGSQPIMTDPNVNSDAPF